MMNKSILHFTLTDGTEVAVSRMTNNKYDFELKLLNGNRKTFVWTLDMPDLFKNLKGEIDRLAMEAIAKFKIVKLTD